MTSLPNPSPTFISSTVDGTPFSTGGTDLVIDKPTLTKQYDLMVAILFSGESSPVFTNPGGWSLGKALGVTVDGTIRRFSVYTKIAGASEASTYNWGGGSPYKLGSILTYRVADQTTPVDYAEGEDGSEGSTSHTVSSVTPTNRYSTVIMAWAMIKSDYGTAAKPSSAPTGMTNRDWIGGADVPTSILYDGLYIADMPQHNIATGTKTLTTAANYDTCMLRIILNNI